MIGDRGISWHDLEAFIKHSNHTSAVYFSVNGHNWGPEHFIMKFVSDTLAGANWQRGHAKGEAQYKGYPYPKTLQEELDKRELEERARKETYFYMSAEETQARLDRYNFPVPTAEPETQPEPAPKSAAPKPSPSKFRVQNVGGVQKLTEE